MLSMSTQRGYSLCAQLILFISIVSLPRYFHTRKTKGKQLGLTCSMKNHGLNVRKKKDTIISVVLDLLLKPNNAIGGRCRLYQMQLKPITMGI